MPTWVIIILLLIIIASIYNLFAWIAEHITQIGIIAISIFLIFVLRGYLVIVLPMILAVCVIGAVINSVSSKRKTSQKELDEKALVYESITKSDIEQENKEILLSGYGYVDSIAKYKDLITNETMVKEVGRLESTLRKIFDEVRVNPEKIRIIQRLVDYYLPTVDNALSHYVQFEENNNVGDNVENSRKSVQETMGTINEAVASIYDNLFYDDNLDISSDLIVLKQMFEADGLINHNKK